MIKENVLPDSLSFGLPPAPQEDVNKIIRSLNTNKATGLTSVISHNIS